MGSDQNLNGEAGVVRVCAASMRNAAMPSCVDIVVTIATVHDVDVEIEGGATQNTTHPNFSDFIVTITNSGNIEEQIEITAHYSGYLQKQEADIVAFRKDENLLIPENIDYSKLSGLSNEVKDKFKLIRPKTLGQALRIDGITPAAVYILLSYVKKTSKKLKIA